ncbi:MAG: cytochrome c biogenesis protein CcdA [Actinobacteria bacterium]|nr:cytochrome c biogenesis protein CcdA [Actinomycetota bacterium]
MIDAPLAYAFTTGMVATVNPCGFAMLPAYLGFFLGADDEPDRDLLSSLVRGLVVGATVSAGFLVLFAAAGMLVSWTSIGVGEISPWFTVAIGAVLLVGGIAFARGWMPRILLPRLDKGGRDTTLWSMFVFGISYAIASLSCTLPVFTTVVVTTFSRENLWSGVATFAAYGLGMGMLLMVLTLTLAAARQGMVTALRRALPYVHTVSGVIMALMGAYLVWWGIYEIRLLRQNKPTDGTGPIDVMTRWSAHLTERLAGLDAMQVALTFALLIASVLFVFLLRADRAARNR